MIIALCAVPAKGLSRTSIAIINWKRHAPEEEEEEILEAQKRLLERMESSVELPISWWTTCGNVIVLRFKEYEHKEDKIKVEERLSLKRRVPIVQRHSVGARIEMHELFRNDVVRQSSRDFRGYDLERKYGT